jgi:uncharacterized protein YraI
MSESAYYMEDLKKPNARLYLYQSAVGGANGVEASENFCKYFTEYKPQHALSLICLKLQDNCVSIGSKKYASTDELKQETDTAQIDLIKKALMETDSILLVWLSSLHKDKLPSANAFSNQPVSNQFFLLGLFPYLLFKDIDPNWETNSSKILLDFINESPGRADLFEAYAAQGLPLNDPINIGVVRAKSPLDYILNNFYLVDPYEQYLIRIKHGEDTVVNLIRLLVKLGANPGASADNLLMAVKTSSVPLVKLMLDFGADQAKRNDAYKYVAKKTNIYSSDKEIMRLLNPSDLTKASLVPGRIVRGIGNVFAKVFEVIDDIADDMYDEAPSFIISGIFALGIALGAWALLGRVLGIGVGWNVFWFIMIILGAFFLTMIAFGYKYAARPVNIFFSLIFAITGAVSFFAIPKPAEPANPSPVEFTMQEITIKTATVTSDSLNYRSGPGTSNDIIKTLRRGDSLVVTGVEENGWVPVQHENDFGYVSSDLIATEDSTDYIVQTATVTKNNIKMRKTPANSYTPIQTLEKGDTVNIAGGPTDNGWRLVEYSGDFGYVNAKDISMNNGQPVLTPPTPTTPVQTTPTQTTTAQTTPAATTPTQTTTPSAQTVTRGRLTFGNDVYDGDIVNGKAQGKGKYTFASGTVYEGDLVNGDFNGKGKMTWTDGNVYEGDFVNDKRTGKGKYTFSSGSVYEGDFVDGIFQGRGKYIWGRGSENYGDVYEGSYVNDLRHGKGKYTWADGAVYDGDWVNGSRTGKGKYTYASGTVYEGDFVNGYFQGKGKMTWKDGDVYEGDFFNDLRHGRGKYVYASGTIEDGRWEEGKFLGAN